MVPDKLGKILTLAAQKLDDGGSSSSFFGWSMKVVVNSLLSVRVLLGNKALS